MDLVALIIPLRENSLNGALTCIKAHSGTSQASKMDLFTRIVNDFN